MPSCVVKWCRNHTNLSKNSGITFHTFPQNRIRRELWKKAVQLERRENEWMPSKVSVVCSLHFKEEDFYSSKKGFKQLYKTATPICTMIIPSEKSMPLTESETIQPELSNILLSPSRTPVLELGSEGRTEAQIPQKPLVLASENAGEEYTPTLWYYKALSFLDYAPDLCRSESDSLDTVDSSFDEDSTARTSTGKKRKTESVVKQERVETEQKCTSDLAQKHELCESYGRYIGHQIKGINEHQLAICQKIISDTIFLAKLNKLNEYSHVVTPPEPPNLQQNQFYSMPSSTSFDPQPSQLVDVRSQQSATITSSPAVESFQVALSPEGNSTDDDPLLVIKSETTETDCDSIH